MRNEGANARTRKARRVKLEGIECLFMRDMTNHLDMILQASDRLSEQADATDGVITGDVVQEAQHRR